MHGDISVAYVANAGTHNKAMNSDSINLIISKSKNKPARLCKWLSLYPDKLIGIALGVACPTQKTV
jgi:hypothetical protein